MTNAANTSYEGRVTSSGTTRTLRPGPPQPSIPTRSGASPTTRTNRTDLQDLTSYCAVMGTDCSGGCQTGARATFDPRHIPSAPSPARSDPDPRLGIQHGVA